MINPITEEHHQEELQIHENNNSEATTNLMEETVHSEEQFQHDSDLHDSLHDKHMLLVTELKAMQAENAYLGNLHEDCSASFDSEIRVLQKQIVDQKRALEKEAWNCRALEMENARLREQNELLDRAGKRSEESNLEKREVEELRAKLSEIAQILENEEDLTRLFMEASAARRRTEARNQMSFDTKEDFKETELSKRHLMVASRHLRAIRDVVYRK